MLGSSIVLDVARVPRLKERLRFPVAAVERLARRTVQGQLDRVARGQDRDDLPMKPLAPAYARRKQRRGLEAKRDMRFTGNMLRAVSVHEATSDGYAVGIGEGAHPKVRKAAYFRQLFDGWFGLSDTNLQELDAELKPIFDDFAGDLFA